MLSSSQGASRVMSLRVREFGAVRARFGRGCSGKGYAVAHAVADCLPVESVVLSVDLLVSGASSAWACRERGGCRPGNRCGSRAEQDGSACRSSSRRNALVMSCGRRRGPVARIPSGQGRGWWSANRSLSPVVCFGVDRPGDDVPEKQRFEVVSRTVVGSGCRAALGCETTYSRFCALDPRCVAQGYRPLSGLAGGNNC